MGEKIAKTLFKSNKFQLNPILTENLVCIYIYYIYINILCLLWLLYIFYIRYGKHILRAKIHDCAMLSYNEQELCQKWWIYF